MRLKDKTVLITGAGSGLGRECALLFAREGAGVVVTDKNKQRAMDVSNRVNENGGTAIWLKCDVTVEAEVAQAIDSTVEKFGKLDVMYANAGVAVPGFGNVSFAETTLESWEAVHDTNLKGFFLCAKHAARQMIKQGYGNILATSSSSAFAGFPGWSIYAASKGGLNALVRNLSFDLGPFGVRVNAVCPHHGMSVNLMQAEDAAVTGLSYEQAMDWSPETRAMPLKLNRPPTLADNAYGALFLASDESAYMSGICLPTCDGGSLARSSMHFEESLGGMAARANALNA